MLGAIIRSVNYIPGDLAIRSERNFTLTANKGDAGRLELTVEANSSEKRNNSSADNSSSDSQSDSSSEITESEDDSNDMSGDEGSEA